MDKEERAEEENESGSEPQEKGAEGHFSKSQTQGRWTADEHQLFLEALKLYGKNWKKIQAHIKTRTGPQIRSHAQKFFNRLEREYQRPINRMKGSELANFFKSFTPSKKIKASVSDDQDSHKEPSSEDFRVSQELQKSLKIYLQKYFTQVVDQLVKQYQEGEKKLFNIINNEPSSLERLAKQNLLLKEQEVVLSKLCEAVQTTQSQQQQQQERLTLTQFLEQSLNSVQEAQQDAQNIFKI